MMVLTGLLCLGSVSACTSDNEDIKGTYRFEKTIYMNPLSSMLPTKENSPKYVITGDYIAIIQTDGTKQQITANFSKSDVDVNTFGALFMEFSAMGQYSAPDVSGFKQRYQYSVNEQYLLYKMDDRLWLAQLALGKDKKMWYIYQLVNTD